MNRRRFSVVSLCLFVLVVGLLPFPFACEPPAKVTYQNQTNEDVNLFVATVLANGSIDGFVDFGIIPAKTTKTIWIAFIGDEHQNRLEIRDITGKVLLSHDYRRADLEKIGWKIIIPP